MIFNLGANNPTFPLVITGYPNATVTITNGKKTFSQVTDSSGNTTFEKLQKGTWTVTASAGGQSNTYTVEIGKGLSNTLNINVVPAFSYNGSYVLCDDNGNAISRAIKNWQIKFLTGGTLVFTDLRGAAKGIDVFCVGGGAGSGLSDASELCGGGGGGSGYTQTVKKKSVNAGTSYVITIGAGGGAGSNGGNTSAFSCTANGGKSPSNSGGWNPGGAGGSGGGAGRSADTPGGAGGTNGGNGGNLGDRPGGTGQGYTTRAFGESGGTLYSTGGAGNYDGAGAANTGNGGSSCTRHPSGIGFGGGSGIAIIRNTRS